MKTLYTLLFSFLWLLGFSQNPILFNKNWRIENITMDGATTDISNNQDAYFMTFYSDFTFNYVSKVCSENYGKINYSTSSDDFVITVAHNSENGCYSDEMATFDSQYSLFFQKYVVPAVPNKITYEIQQNQEGYTLTITNLSGDKVTYGFYTPQANLTSQSWTLSSLDIASVHYNRPTQSIGGQNLSDENLIINTNGGISALFFNSGQGGLGFYPDSKFRILDLGITLSMSGNSEIDIFDGLYLGNFFPAGGDNNSYSYTISADGETLIITKSNGDIATYNKKALGISEPSVTNLEIYPNPASEVLIIKNLKPNSNLELIDNSGKLVKSTSSKTTKTEINIKNLTSGIYYLKVNGKSVQKIIKK